MPFSLPKVFRVEGSKDGVDPGRELPLSEGRLSLFLDARTELARIDVLGESGAQLATLAESEFEEAPTVLKQSSVDAPPPQQGLARDYPHIDFLGPDEDVGVFSPEYFLETLAIGVEEAKNIRIALNQMSDAAFGAVRTITVARFKADSPSQGVTYGSTVVLDWRSANLGPESSKVLAHEATHAYEYLVNGGVGVTLFNKTDWPGDVKAAAQQAIQDFQLQAGLTSVWNDLHDDAVDAGLGGAYLGDQWGKLGLGEEGDPPAAPLGFASGYGASDASEDLAEYVGRLVIPKYGRSPVCDLVKNAGDPFPVARALPYIKVKFSKGLVWSAPSRRDLALASPRSKVRPAFMSAACLSATECEVDSSIAMVGIS